MPDQLMLFDIPAKLLRRPPRVLLHLADAGYVDGTGDVVQWRCSRCGHETDWQPETKARPPCLRCNVEPTVCPDCGSDHGCHECYGLDVR